MLSSAAQIIKDKSYKFFAPKFFEVCIVKDDKIIGLCFTGKGDKYSISGKTNVPLPAPSFSLSTDDIIDCFDKPPFIHMAKFFVIDAENYQRISQKLPASYGSLLQIYGEAAKMRQNGQKNAVLIDERNGEFHYTFFLTDKVKKPRQYINNILPSLKEEMTILDEGDYYKAILGNRTIFVSYPRNSGGFGIPNDFSDFDKDDLKALTSACFYPLTCCGFSPSQKAITPIPWKKYCRHIAVLCLIFLCSVNLFFKSKVTALRQGIENAQDKILACRNLTQEEKNIRQQERERRRRQKKLLALEKNPYSNHMILDELASHLPEDNYIWRIERQGDELTIRGLAETDQAANACYKSFQNLLFCQSIAVDQIRGNADGWFDFTFIIKLNGRTVAPDDGLFKRREVTS